MYSFPKSMNIHQSAINKHNPAGEPDNAFSEMLFSVIYHTFLSVSSGLTGLAPEEQADSLLVGAWAFPANACWLGSSSSPVASVFCPPTH